MDPTRRLLEDERAQTLRRLARLTGDHAGVVEASRDSNADDEHDPEGATIAFERAQVEALVHRAESHLLEIDAAAARLDAGTYGTCESCGLPIPAERLAARSVARTCIACANAR